MWQQLNDTETSMLKWYIVQPYLWWYIHLLSKSRKKFPVLFSISRVRTLIRFPIPTCQTPKRQGKKEKWRKTTFCMTIFARGTLNANQGVYTILFAFKYKNTFRLTQFASRPVTPVLSTATSGHTCERDREHLLGAVQKSGETQMLQHSPPEHTPQFLQVKGHKLLRMQSDCSTHGWILLQDHVAL